MDRSLILICAFTLTMYIFDFAMFAMRLVIFPNYVKQVTSIMANGTSPLANRKRLSAYAIVLFLNANTPDGSENQILGHAI